MADTLRVETCLVCRDTFISSNGQTVRIDRDAVDTLVYQLVQHRTGDGRLASISLERYGLCAYEPAPIGRR